MKNILLVPCLFLFASCNGSDFDQIYAGKYVWGAEINSFAPCNSALSYWASYNWAGMEMHEFYKANSKSPYQPMYIEFRGHLLDEVVDGFALDYDGLIRISEVKVFSFDLPASCQ